MNIEWWQSIISGKYYTRIVGGNGEGMYTSQGHTTKFWAIASAQKAIHELRYAKIKKRKFK